MSSYTTAVSHPNLTQSHHEFPSIIHKSCSEKQIHYNSNIQTNSCKIPLSRKSHIRNPTAKGNRSLSITGQLPICPQLMFIQLKNMDIISNSQGHAA